MIHTLDDDLAWIHQCYATDDWHMHTAQYLIGDTPKVLIDAGSDHRRGEAIGEINEALAGADLDTLLLTHSILPHTENLPAIQAEWPDIEIIAATNAPTVVGLPDQAEPKVLNDRRTIVGETFSFLDPLLTDVVGSNWVLHEGSGTLFTAEGVGHYHHPNDCNRTSAGMPDGIPRDAIHAFHRDKLAFLGYVDPAKLRAGFMSILDSFEINRIAPMHGNPVEADDIHAYVERVIESAAEFAEAWTPEHGIPGD